MRKYPLLAFTTLIYSVLAFADEKTDSIASLKQTLFSPIPAEVDREEIDLSFQRSVSSQYISPKFPFRSLGDRIYWEILEYPTLWEELTTTFDREIAHYLESGTVTDDLRFTIAQIYFFGRLSERPIYFQNGIDLEDKKLPFSATIGTAAEMAQCIKNSGAKKVFEIFSGRGNMTLLLSLSGLEELITVERDREIDLAASWKSAIDQLQKDIPPIFWPPVTEPLFLYGDILEIDLPSAEVIIMDPPYGYASSCYTSVSEAFLFYLTVLNRLQNEPNSPIYSIIPNEWTSMIRLFDQNPTPVQFRESVHSILQNSFYFQRRPEKWAGFIETIENDDYIEKIEQLIRTIQETSKIDKTPIRNVLGKDLDILQSTPRNNTQILRQTISLPHQSTFH